MNVTMQDAVDAGDGTLHGAIDYWQNRSDELESYCRRAYAALDAAIKKYPLLAASEYQCGHEKNTVGNIKAELCKFKKSI